MIKRTYFYRVKKFFDQTYRIQSGCVTSRSLFARPDLVLEELKRRVIEDSQTDCLEWLEFKRVR